MQLTSFFVSIFGIVLVLRTLPQMNRVRVKNFLILSLFIEIIFIYFSLQLKIIWLIFLFVLFAIAIYQSLAKQRQVRFLRQSIPLMYENLYMLVLSGMGFRPALQKLILDPNLARQKQLQKIVHSLDWETKDGLSDPDWELVRTQFVKLSARPHRIQEEIKIYQSDWIMRERFRQKSSQMLLQARIQAGIMCFLFLPLLFWNLQLQPLNISRICLALTLFAVGQIFLLRLGRNIKWKV